MTKVISFIVFLWIAVWFGNAAPQQGYESERVRFQTEIVATGLKQPSAMVFLPDGRALLVERQRGIDLFDPKSGVVRALEGGPEALLGADSGAQDRNRPVALTGED